MPSLSAITTIFTIGHSTHEAGAFLELLRRARIEAVADVRRYPSSRRMPWFSASALEASLAEAGVEYRHFPELGGRRDPQPGSPNGGWQVGQFQGYADHMASAEFEAGLERLVELAGERRTAVMCAEARWNRCHRRLLSDALLAGGHAVLHIDARGRAERHRLTDFAVTRGGQVSYPAAQGSLLN